ncbi:adenylate cyclase type 3 isoform X2 [Halyomorpha halys]|uniref:adenylate cyclase type 3 isoform X2 n=1 Tax=Halyomorpha halys TaxID=286706 RepID=UPI0034D2B51B
MQLEALYTSYSVRQRRPALPVFLVVSCLYDVFCLVLPLHQDTLNRAISGLFVCLNLGLLLATRLPGSRFTWSALSHLSWHAANLQILARMFFSPDLTPRTDLGWVLVLDYLVYVTLPLRLRYCLVLALGMSATYLVSLFGLSKSDLNLYSQVGGNVLLLATANLLGLVSSYLEQVQQRTAFLDTKQCLEMKLVIEEQSAEQERLLLSVLPEHVAVKMRQDLGSALDSQFKKIYMSRHENVSILYADIVGFTAISSTYSASELVKILNELFARFDRLSERYQQLRIKILGDCYYCISGAPRERPDHAALSIHMGLSMVKAIKYVQQKTNSPVDMRVGIHTGAVLAGVLGQRQWQFDVYSKDVELANKMESSGLPGRVHISEKTLSFLNGEFEVEPAYGEKREETLRMAGIKTFFIVRTIIPYKGQSDMRDLNSDKDLEEFFEDKEGVITPVEDNGGRTGRKDSEDFKQRLRKDLMNRDGHRDLVKHTSLVTRSFKDKQREYNYTHNTESFSSISLIGCPLVIILTSIAQAFILPNDSTSIMSVGISSWFLIIITLFTIAEAFPNVFPEQLLYISKIMNYSVIMRRLLAVVFILVINFANFIDMTSCIVVGSKTSNCSMSDDPGEACLYPSYFSHMAVLVLVAAALPVQLSHIMKAALLFVIVDTHTFGNLYLMRKALDCEDISFVADPNRITPGKYTVSVMLGMICIGLMVLMRHMECASRVLFLWKTEAEEQRERASDMGRRNEALVYNILPPHVAVHFLGNRKRQHEELYSQSYAEVGVLFASMPNFSDFYSEETVNNQGLECLRFLNEVISDFDALLELPKFQDIIKIKTIGSTYMAASGLNPSRVVKPDDPTEVRWAHLGLLVEFALELKKALQSINEQSFNHFVLKMGINHGPITAGVIGARKPHYDIWGNTVNVASRMESTGKAGCIQVTAETCEILQSFGYTFEQRGLVAVKGKGQLMTYYLIGKGGGGGVYTPQTSPQPGGERIMETVKEEEEEEEAQAAADSDQTALLNNVSVKPISGLVDA